MVLIPEYKGMFSYVRKLLYRGYFVHVVPQLQKRFRGVRFFAGRGFQVEKKQHIGLFFAVLNNDPLIGDDKGIALDMFIVDQFHQCGTLFFVVIEVNRNAVLQIIHEPDVLLECGTAFEIPQFIDCFGNSNFRQCRIDPMKSGKQFIRIKWIGIIADKIRSIDTIIPSVSRNTSITAFS